MYILVIKQLSTMLFILVAGFVFAKVFKVEEREQKFLSKILLYLINPLMVFNSFDREFSKDKLLQLGFITIVALLIHLVMIFISIIFTSSKKKELQDFNLIDRVAIVFTNCGFMGIPLINGVFGSEGVFYLMGYLVIFNVLLWTFGYYQMSGNVKISKIILNPNIIAVCCGVIFYCFQIKLPEVIKLPLVMIGDVNTTVAMILIGILLAGFEKPESKTFAIRIIRFNFIRLILCSLVNIAVITGLYYICNNSSFITSFVSVETLRTMLFIVLICSFCPAATSVPSLACVFDKNTDYASVLVSLTSLLCMISIPAFVALAGLFLK